MKILFIHQNFPGQFKHLAPALAARGDEVIALSPQIKTAHRWQGVRMIPYRIARGSTRGMHPWVADFETKVIRAEACFNAALQLRAQGFEPDVIVAHFGWGESMFLKDVWPAARIGLFCEFFNRPDYPYAGFDPEFEHHPPSHNGPRLRVRNLNSDIHLPLCDAALSPTQFQAASYPSAWQDKITVIHDGIDTAQLTRRADAQLTTPSGRVLTDQDEVITFVNRNFEPYRGYHIFMRALPELLRSRPNAHVVMVGGDDVSYGARPPKGSTWKQIFIDEVRPSIPDADWARVHFMGRVPYDAFTAMLSISGAHVYLTYPFVLSWSLLEAMSLGAPIVASSTGPVTEVIQEGRNGRLFDFFDTQALVAQVNECLDDRDMTEGLRAAARADVVAQYDLQTQCLPKLLAWVDALAQMDAAPAPL
ncbi:MAG: glycosyltransferase [Paracoccaceae bacterium]